MQVSRHPRDAQKICQTWRNSGMQVGFVATMGALHDGHLSLLERAIAENDITCASIFVNPLQFNDPKDLDTYPMSLDDDLHQFEKHGCDLVFTGTLDSFFPEAGHPGLIRRLDPGPFASDLEGVHRPGFFEGVVTIVDRLFRTVGDCKAYFGEKDFQQTLVVKHLSAQLKKAGFNIEIVACPTVRNSDGLALSSRNRHLGKPHTETAKRIYHALHQARLAWQLHGLRNREKLNQIMLSSLEHPDIDVDYTAVRNPDDWHSQATELKTAIGLIAVCIEGIRLIDNMLFDRKT